MAQQAQVLATKADNLSSHTCHKEAHTSLLQALPRLLPQPEVSFSCPTSSDTVNHRPQPSRPVGIVVPPWEPHISDMAQTTLNPYEDKPAPPSLPLQIIGTLGQGLGVTLLCDLM